MIDQSHNYLKRMMQNREEKHPVASSMRHWPMHMMEEMAWVEKDTVTGGTFGRIKCPSGDGQLFFMLAVLMGGSLTELQVFKF